MPKQITSSPLLQYKAVTCTAYCSCKSVTVQTWNRKQLGKLFSCLTSHCCRPETTLCCITLFSSVFSPVWNVDWKMRNVDCVECGMIDENVDTVRLPMRQCLASGCTGLALLAEAMEKCLANSSLFANNSQIICK